MKQLSDTNPVIEAILIEGYRRMSPREKLERVASLNRALDQLAMARLKKSYPDDSDRDLQLRLASLSIDKELMIKAFNWNPEEHGY